MGRTTYYDYRTVRDQILNAQKINKCTHKFDLPANVDSIDNNWVTQCKSPCALGWCEVFLYVLIPNVLPIRVNMYYEKKAPIAYVSFTPATLNFLAHLQIINIGVLKIVKDVPARLPAVQCP